MSRWRVKYIVAIAYGLIIALVLTALMAVFSRYVRRYRTVLYAAMIVIDAYFVLANYLGYEVFTDDRNFNALFCSGVLSTALFMVVAYIGCLPDGHRLTKKLKSIRAELSVLGCILGFGQMIYYGNQFVQFFNGELSAGRELATVATLVLLVLMIPLMLTSFYCVRTNMKHSTWKRLQRFSYVFYFALWVHVFGLYANLNGGLDGLFDGKHAEALIWYTVIWWSYYIIRTAKFLYDRSKGVYSDDGIIQNDDGLVGGRFERWRRRTPWVSPGSR